MPCAATVAAAAADVGSNELNDSSVADFVKSNSTSAQIDHGIIIERYVYTLPGTHGTLHYTSYCPRYPRDSEHEQFAVA